jgi:hypothetical protein
VRSGETDSWHRPRIGMTASMLPIRIFPAPYHVYRAEGQVIQPPVCCRKAAEGQAAVWGGAIRLLAFVPSPGRRVLPGMRCPSYFRDGG